jgi:hypothetical protein
MFTVQRNVGKLFEARVFRLATLADLEQYSHAFARARSEGELVLCADHRPVAIYPPAVADRLVALFKVMNVHWQRVAVLVARSNATLAMQLQRIVRESGNPSRRVFFDAADANRFLAEVLDEKERARLSAFLEETPSAPPSGRASR